MVARHTQRAALAVGPGGNEPGGGGKDEGGHRDLHADGHAQARGTYCVVAGKQRCEAQFVEGGNAKSTPTRASLISNLCCQAMSRRTPARQQQHEQRPGDQQAADDEDSPPPNDSIVATATAGSTRRVTAISGRARRATSARPSGG